MFSINEAFRLIQAFFVDGYLFCSVCYGFVSRSLVGCDSWDWWVVVTLSGALLLIVVESLYVIYECNRLCRWIVSWSRAVILLALNELHMWQHRYLKWTAWVVET